jgi:purine nucleosidase
MPRNFWIDTDTASDDAVALIMALQNKSVAVRGISAVAGNVPLPQAAKNALYVAELCSADVPVYIGARRPLKQKPAHATWFHGKDGLGNHNYPAAKRSAEKAGAIKAIIAAAEKFPALTLVTLGPLTNIALALKKSPAIARKISRLVIMGGAACTEGNVTPAAEYNIWCDPEAADIVFRAGWKNPPEMVGWELSRFDAVFGPADIKKLLALKTPLAKFAVECNSVAISAYHTQTGERGMSLPDPVAMAVALEPEIAARKSTHLTLIETASPLTRGMSVVDRLNVAGDPRNRKTWQAARHITTIWKIDVARFKAILLQSCK